MTLRGIFLRLPSDFSQEEAFEQVNKLMENARQAKAAKALQLCEDIKSKLKVIEKAFAAKKITGPYLESRISHAYQNHAQILDKLGYDKMARKSHKKADEWGCVHPISINGAMLQSFCPSALTVVPSATEALHQNTQGSSIAQPSHHDLKQAATPVKIESCTPDAGGITLQTTQRIFTKNITPVKYNLPELGEQFTSTPQLAYCLSLLCPSLKAKNGFNDNEMEWSRVRASNPDELKRIQTVATNIIQEFIHDKPKKPDAVSEVVCLAAPLDRDDFRELLHAFVNGIENSVLLKVHLLHGLAQLLGNANPEHIDSDDLVKILDILNTKLKETHQQSAGHIYQLASTVSHVLDSMVDNQVKGLKHEQLHKPLFDYLKELQDSSNPSLVYQALYGYQALLYIPDDESTLQAMLRRTGKVAQGISGVVSAVKALDLNGFIGGLQNIQKGLEGAGDAIKLLGDAYENAKTLAESGMQLKECLVEGLSFSRKSAWYPALRGLDAFLQEGKLIEFEKLILEAPCRRDAPFQWGVCQRLGEIAVNAQWSTDIRLSAISFLGEIYNSNTKWAAQADIKDLITCIFSQLANSTDATVATNARGQAQRLKDTNDLKEQALPGISSSVYHVIQPGAPKVWDLYQYMTSSDILLKTVQQKADRQKNIEELPAQFVNVIEAVESNASHIRLAIDARDSKLQASVDNFAENMTARTSLREVHAALELYYKSSLVIKRVSGDKLDLGQCFVNLAVVEARGQRMKDKMDLKSQAVARQRFPGHQELTDADMTSSIPLEDLFKERKLPNGNEYIPKRILIHGRAGIGKSTLCKKLVHLYQCGLWKERFDAVIWLPLRQLKSQSYCDIEGLLVKRYFSGQPRKAALCRTVLDKIDAGRVLFILDGLDEIVASIGDEEGDLRKFLLDLLKSENVVITSRPSGVDKNILQEIDLELETIGFSPKNINDYLRIPKILSPGQVKSVQEFIDQTPVVQGLVTIPVQLDVICFSWGSFPTDEKEITVTSLYEAMVRKLWRKDAVRLGKSSSGQTLTEDEVQSLDSYEIDRLMDAEIEFMGYLAFEGLKDNHRIEFDEGMLKKAKKDLNRGKPKDGGLPLQLISWLKKTSFLHTLHADLDNNARESQGTWYFLHLTFQEYFAATWLARHLQVDSNDGEWTFMRMMTPEETKEFVLMQKYNPQFEVVWWMVVGMLRGDALALFFDIVQGAPVDLIGGYHHRLLAACMKESRNQLECLDSKDIKSLEAQLAQWLQLEMMTGGDSPGKSTLGSMSYFPEELLIRSIGLSGTLQDYLIKTLGMRTQLTESGVNVLVDVLGGCGNLKELAASTLGKQSTLPESAILALISALQDGDKDVRTSAADALEKHSIFLEPALESLVDALRHEHAREPAAKLLSRQPRLPDSTLKILISALQDKDWRVRHSATEVLGKKLTSSDSALSAIVMALRHKDKDVRESAAKALGNHSALPESAIQSLIDVLRDEDKDVRVSAAEALGKQSTLTESTLSALTVALQDNDTCVKKSAADALEILPESALHSLVWALRNSDKDVRKSVADALEKHLTLPESILKALTVALQDELARYSATEILRKQSTLPGSILEVLIIALKDKDKNIKRSASDILEMHATLPESALDALTSALQHEYARYPAAKILSMQSTLPESALLALTSSLQDKDWRTRYSAAKALGKQSTVPNFTLQALVGALQDEDKYVRKSAASALEKYSGLPESALYSLIGALRHQHTRESAAKILVMQSTLPQLVLDTLIGALQDKDWRVRHSVTEVLGKQLELPESSLIALIGALQDDNEYVRYSVAEALGAKSGLPEPALQALIVALQDEDRDVRVSAAETLGAQEKLSESALMALVSALRHENSRNSAARILNMRPSLPESIVQSLISALQSEDKGVRDSASEALQRKDKDVRNSASNVLDAHSILSESVIQAMVSALTDGDIYVRNSAADILEKHSTLPEFAIQALINALRHRDGRILAAKILKIQLKLPESAILALISVIQIDDQRLRELAADTLAKYTTLSRPAHMALVDVMQNKDKNARSSAAKILRMQSALPELALQALVVALKDEDNDVRRSVADALGKQSILSRSALQDLILALQDEDEYVRCSAAVALGAQSTLPESALSVFVAALRDKSKDVRRSVADALGAQPTLPQSALQSLVVALKDEHGDVKKSVIDALGKQSALPESALKGLIAVLLEDNNSYVRCSAADALGKCLELPEPAHHALIDALQDKDKDVRDSAAQALGRQPKMSELALRKLIGMLQINDLRVRDLAANVLEKYPAFPESAIQALVCALQRTDIMDTAARILIRQLALSEESLKAMINALQQECTKESAYRILEAQLVLPESALQTLVSALQVEDRGGVLQRYAVRLLLQHVNSTFMMIPNLTFAAIETLRKAFLIQYSSNYPASLWVQGHQIFFHTAQGPGKIDRLHPEVIAKVVRAFDQAQKEP